MVTTLKKAIAELADLSDSDQEEIGRKLLSHVEKLQKLRADIDAGLRSLDVRKSKPLDVEEFLDKMNRSHGGLS